MVSVYSYKCWPRDGYVLMLPERERNGLMFCLGPSTWSLKKRSVCVGSRCDDIYTVLEMGVSVVQTNFFNAEILSLVKCHVSSKSLAI